MGVRTLYDPDLDVAVMYDSVTETAIGPLFHGDLLPGLCAVDAVQAFLGFLDPTDPRTLTDVQVAGSFDAFLAAWMNAYYVDRGVCST